jgi:N-methylhydantoinase A
VKRAGIDIGGTFTDVVVVDDDTGAIHITKRLTTPDDPSDAFFGGLDHLLAVNGVKYADLDQIVHGTTLATNTLLERKGDKTALVTTRGFRDVLLIQRQKRYDIYDLNIDKPKSILRRHEIHEVTERVLRTGAVQTPLDEDDVRAVARRLVSEGVKAVAISFLHSYANPAHENRAAALLAEEMPGVWISTSSAIFPKWREYERTNTTVVNSYVMPRVRAYLDKLDGELEKRTYTGALYVMQSNGGMATASMMGRTPVKMIESGPAAGAIIAALYGKLAGFPNVISFDMGGTTAKACPIINGRPGIIDESEVDRLRMRRGSGLPLSIASIDLVEIGAGGGSIAWHELGLIRVGPESSGANPGPICYGNGGTKPTVTDANLVLGFLNPSYFLGGEMSLDVEGAEAGIVEHIGKPLNLDITKAAWAIHEVVNHGMAEAIRSVSVARGLDPRDFALVSFGGAGPLHGARLARMLGIAKGVFPAAAGVASALGLLAADIRFDLVRTNLMGLDEQSLDQINSLYTHMEQQGVELLKESGITAEQRVLRSADIRYVGQGYEVRVPVPNGALTAPDLIHLGDAFHKAYEQVYGFSDPEKPLEGVNWRLEAFLPGRVVQLPKVADKPVGLAVKRSRRAYFPELDGYADCPVYDRYQLSLGTTFDGPAVVEERESTTVILPGDSARVDEYGNLIVEFGRDYRAER